MRKNDAAWVALGLIKHVGGKTLRSLLAQFNQDPFAILAADVKALRAVPGVGTKIASAIREVDLAQVEKSMEYWQSAGLRIVTWQDADYPRSLRPVEDAPPTLFFRGNAIFPPSFKAVAIVGTRQPSPQSVTLAAELSCELASKGYVIVSGLALGIDSAAHRGSFVPPTGQTLAVLGSGILENIYPPENEQLAKAVMTRGALVCEVNPQAAVSTPGLVARNRIITGLCEAVIVVETGIDGGAMHAARFARVQGKRIYAVQNNASGNRHLLENGALAIPQHISDFAI